MAGEEVAAFLEKLQQLIPQPYRVFDSLIFYTLFILVYSIFVFYFYKFVAKKNIFDLNLKQYNVYKKSRFYKLIASILYFVEYILILPALSLVWFGFLALFFIILSKSDSITLILTICAALVASVRITSYIDEDLSKELSKMLPFLLLVFFLVNEAFFNFNVIIQRILSIQYIASNVLIYISFIICVDVILRIVDLIKGVVYEQ